MDAASSGRDTALTGFTSQMSQDTDLTLNTAGDSESQDVVNPARESKTPKAIANQFYPSIDTTLETTKVHVDELHENNCKTELVLVPDPPAIDGNGGDSEVKESPAENTSENGDFPPAADVNEEDSTLKEESPTDNTSVNGDSKSVHFEDAQPVTTTEQVTDDADDATRPETTDSVSLSTTSQQEQEVEGQPEPEGLFSTQVDEETLEAAQQRQAEQQGKLFNTEEWGPSRPPSVSLHQVVNNRVNEHYKAGLKHMDDQHYEKAITAFSKALNLRTNQTVFYVKRAECFLQLCDFQSAILNYKKACVLEPNNFEHYSRLAFIYFFQGQCLFDQKLYPEALESFSRAAEMRPEVIGYHTRSIACLAALERHGECLALVNKRLEADTGSADLYIMRARLHELFKNTTLCYYDVKDALALEPENPEALKMMEGLKLKAKEMKQQAIQLNLVHRHRDALQKISMAIETDPSRADYHLTRGALQRRIGDYNAAIDDYLLAMDKTDHNEESDTYIEAQRQLLLTYNDFAVECFTKGFYEEAVILLNKAIKGEKTEKGLYVNRGDCFFRQGHFQFALADYQQALELDGRDNAINSRIAVIHNEYGVKDYQEKNYQDAESRFSLAIQHSPRMAQYYISRSRARQMMENISGARQDLLMAMHLDSSSSEITSLMARLFPGKTVKDVLRSEAAEGIRQALQNLTVTPSAARSTSVGNKVDRAASAEHRLSRNVKPETSESLSLSTAWKPGDKFPSLNACMMERDFNIRAASERKQIKDQIKDRLHNRKSLSYQGSKRILPLADPAQYTQVGGHAFQKQNVAVNAVNVAGSGQKPTGWKKFSHGIGLNGVPDKL